MTYARFELRSTTATTTLEAQGQLHNAICSPDSLQGLGGEKFVGGAIASVAACWVLSRLEAPAVFDFYLYGVSAKV